MWCYCAVAAIGLFVFNLSGSAAADFLYPPPGSQSHFTFNYLDTVNVSWYNDAGTYSLSFGHDNLTAHSIRTVSATGSELVSLEMLQDPEPICDVNFILQGLSNLQRFSSASFNVTYNLQQAPVLWGAYNGTGPLQSYIFTTTTGPSSSSRPQRSASFVSSQFTTATSASQSTTTSFSYQPTTKISPLRTPNSLSTGAGIGIIAACILGGTSLIAWFWIFTKMRKRNASPSNSDPVPEEPLDMVERPEGEIYESDGRERQVELDSVPRQEIDGVPRHELEVQDWARELDSRMRYELGVRNGAPPFPPELGVLNGAPALPSELE